MKDIKAGQIQEYNPRFKTGFVRFDGEPFPVPFNLDSLRRVRCGFAEPELIPITNWSGLLLDFGPDDEIVARLEVGSTLEVSPTQRTLRRTVSITDWASKVSFDDAWRIIRSRPVYQVMEFQLYKGEPVTGANQRSLVDRGTAIELQSLYPRGAQNDPLAPEHRFLGYTYRRRFYILRESMWVQCPDPRPLAAGQKTEEFQPTNELGLILATATDIALALGQSQLRQAIAA